VVREDRTVVAHAWPTGRPINTYAPQELADGVDVYARLLKARRQECGEGHVARGRGLMSVPSR